MVSLFQNQDGNGKKPHISKEHEIVDVPFEKLCDESCVSQRKTPVNRCLQMQEVGQLEDLGRDGGKTVAI